MTLKLTRLISILVLFCYSQIINACAGPGDDFIEMPESYIDAGILSKYTIFDMILNQYGKMKEPEDASITKNDSTNRKLSQENEPELYAKYLKGAEKFSDREYEGALQIFVELRNTPFELKDKIKQIFNKNYTSWVREASTYMIARCELIISQNDWDGYSLVEKGVNLELLRRAKSSYDLYLKEYPNGLYANSAVNINRKILFLMNDCDRLNEELKNLLTEGLLNRSGFYNKSNQSFYDSVIEFRNYFNGKADLKKDHPMIILYDLLDNSRKFDHNEIEILKSRENDFSKYPGLYRYVYSLALYKAASYEELIDYVSKYTSKNDLLDSSTDVLTAKSLIKLNRYNEAFDIFQKLIKLTHEDLLELEIINLKMIQGTPLWIYTSESPVVAEKNLQAVAKFILTDQELESGMTMADIKADNRKILLEELATRYLLTMRFNQLSSLIEKEIDINFLDDAKDAIKKLATNPENLEGLVDIAEFIYTMLYYRHYNVRFMGDYQYIFHCWFSKEDETKFEERIKNYISPIIIFRKVVSITREKDVLNEAEAKALHYIVTCVRRGCKWYFDKRPDSEEGKKAFKRLHKFYKKSPWTKMTPYYY